MESACPYKAHYFLWSLCCSVYYFCVMFWRMFVVSYFVDFLKVNDVVGISLTKHFSLSPPYLSTIDSHAVPDYCAFSHCWRPYIDQIQIARLLFYISSDTARKKKFDWSIYWQKLLLVCIIVASQICYHKHSTVNIRI